jgi:hypothetical protein
MDMKVLGLAVHSELKKYPGGKFIVFSDEFGTAEKPGRIVKEYHKQAIKFKSEIFGKDANKHYINYHKIAALYIRSFLKYPPLYLEISKAIKNPELCLLTKLPNEYYVVPFLQSVFKAGTEDFDGVLDLDPKYRDNFIKLLYGYRNGTVSLDPASLANIISLIEDRFFIHS